MQEDEEGDETTTLVVYDRLEDYQHRRRKGRSPDGIEMASVNVNPEDIITSAEPEAGPRREESGFSREYPGSVNRSYDEGDEDENLLERDLDVDGEDKDDRTLVACLAPRDRFWGVYFIFYFLGITTLLPWNFFINADKVCMVYNIQYS